jgi:hypothetical protein
MRLITLDIELQLIPQSLSHPIDIQWDDTIHRLQYDPVRCRVRRTVDLDLPVEHLELCSIRGFSPGQTRARIEVKPVSIGTTVIQDWDLFSQIWSDGTRIDNCHEITRDGKLVLRARDHIGRLTWSPWYQSARRSDFVFKNELLDDWGTAVRPWHTGMFGMHDTRVSRKLYRNEPHLPTDAPADTVYSAVCFGCSFTYGSAMLEQELWPNLLGLPRVLNLAVPGLGIDGCLQQLTRAQQVFQWERTILLLPGPYRELIRFQLPHTGQWVRTSISAAPAIDWENNQLKQWAWGQLGISMQAEDIERLRRRFTDTLHRMIMQETPQRSWRCVDRIQRHCERAGRPYYIGTWDEETHHYMSSRLPEQHLLPLFPRIDLARDDAHPGPRSHAQWAEQIRPLVQ